MTIVVDWNQKCICTIGLTRLEGEVSLGLTECSVRSYSFVPWVVNVVNLEWMKVNVVNVVERGLLGVDECQRDIKWLTKGRCG